MEIESSTQLSGSIKVEIQVQVLSNRYNIYVLLVYPVAIEIKIAHWFLSALGFSDCLTYIYVGFCLIFDP